MATQPKPRSFSVLPSFWSQCPGQKPVHSPVTPLPATICRHSMTLRFISGARACEGHETGVCGVSWRYYRFCSGGKRLQVRNWRLLFTINQLPGSKYSSSTLFSRIVSSSRHPMLYLIMSFARRSPSMRTILIPKPSAAALAEGLKAELVKNIPF